MRLVASNSPLTFGRLAAEGSSALGFNLDFTTAATSYPGVVSTTSGTIWLMRSASTVVSAVANDACYEDRGGPEGGGIWTGAWTNLAPNPNDFNVAAGWTQTDTIVISTSSVVAPDGSFAQKVFQTTTPMAYMGHAITSTPGPVTYSLFYSMDVTNPPSGVGRAALLKGAFAPYTFGVLPLASPVPMARFLTVVQGTPTTEVGVTPAGSNAAGNGINTATGAYAFWGLQAVLDIHDFPLGAGPASVTKTLDTAHSAAVVRAGDLDLDIEFMLSMYDQFYEVASFMWSFTTADGRTSLRWVPGSPGSWVLEVRGVDVATMSTPLYSTPSQVQRIRCWYNLHSATCGIRASVGGCFAPADVTAATSGSALIAPSTVYLGSNLGSVTSPFGGRFARVHRSPAAVPDAAKRVEILLVGDSIVSPLQYGGGRDLPSPGANIYTLAESRTRAGVGNIAQSGDKVLDQRDLWLVSPWRHASGILAVCIQVGINNVAHGSTASSTITDLQTLVNQIRTDQPAAKIILHQMLPAKSYLDTLSAGYYPIWQDINASIAGLTTSPNGHTVAAITGVDGRVLMGSLSCPLNDGADSMPAIYTMEGLHTNALGRVLNGDDTAVTLSPIYSFRGGLRAAGLL